VSAYPESARAHQSMAENLLVLRRTDEAQKEYEQALKLRPDTPHLHLELGEVFALASRWPEAEEQFRAESALQPGNAEAAYWFGDALLRQRKAREAQSLLERSNKLQPQMPETFTRLERRNRSMARLRQPRNHGSTSSRLKKTENWPRRPTLRWPDFTANKERHQPRRVR
jgi:tetratricopeptide (TPR) repeat protein